MTEIERKFLISFPNEEMLKNQEGAKVYKIWQTYLESRESIQERVRKRECLGAAEYFHTKKVFISDKSRIEDEVKISMEEYSELLKRIKQGTRTLEKTRYAIPFGHHVVEIDVYPFACDWAVCEVELSREDEAFELPSYLDVIREITGERKYSNETLSKI